MRRGTEKSKMPATVSAGMPGPLSVMMMSSSLTSMRITGAVPASSAASRALSVNSLRTTSGHWSGRGRSA